MVASETPVKMTYSACTRADTTLEVPIDMIAIDFDGGSYVGCEHVGSRHDRADDAVALP